MSKNNNQGINNSLKIVIVMLAFTMLGGIFFLYKSGDRSKSTIVSLREEKSNVLKDLEQSQLFLNQVMTSNKSLSSKLVEEQNKVKQLILDLKSKDVNEKTIAEYKQTVSNVDNRIKLLLNEINSYKKQIDSTNVVLSKTNVVLKNEKTKNDTLTVSNKKLAKKITEASKLYFYNLQTASYKTKSSGNQTQTDKASKIDLLKISFMIAENDLVKATDKDFYVQIIDTKNNVIGSKGTQIFGNETLTFSTSMKLKYENKTIKIEGEIPVTNLEKGSYFVNVFDNSKLVLKSTFNLL
ncbi:hypothetical protein [Flavobacterium sp.]|uniref:hypothetical protein n=1 Tax=Flavobacterium sp. TaxID=239 RepID=UPI00374C8F9F